MKKGTNTAMADDWVNERDEKKLSVAEYLDLTNPETNLGEVRIVPRNYDCRILGDDGHVYRGFVLAKSDGGKALTVCEMSFHWSDKDKKHAPRPTFRRTDSALHDRPVPARQQFQRISFHGGQDGYREFWKMIAFLYKFKEVVDLGDFTNVYRAVSEEGTILNIRNRSPSERTDFVARIAQQSGIDDMELSELLAIRSRKEALETFRKLLVDENDYLRVYRDHNATAIKKQGEEAIWHHFLSSNKWIFGLSLELCFIRDFVDEAAVGIADTSSHGSPRVDVLAWTDYTILIELKTPRTKFFTLARSEHSRAGTWSFSIPFIEGISQCLAQRSSWDKSSSQKSIVVPDDSGRTHQLDHSIRTIDPKVIFIVGNKSAEIPSSSNYTDVLVRRDTLERFSRNNRNVNIISYDELYARAYHIVYNSEPPLSSTVVQPF